MGILVIITTTIPKSFWIMIRHRSNSILVSFFSFVYLYFVICFAPFQCFCLFVSCCLSCTLSMFLFICILLFILHPFNVFFLLFICVLLWTFLMNWTFIGICLTNQECKKILMEQNDIKWNLQNFIFEKTKLITNKLLCPHKII